MGRPPPPPPNPAPPPPPNPKPPPPPPHLDLGVRVAHGAAVVGADVGDAALAECQALHLRRQQRWDVGVQKGSAKAPFRMSQLSQRCCRRGRHVPRTPCLLLGDPTKLQGRRVAARRRTLQSL